MAVITFSQIRERVAEHTRREAIRNAPAAAARRAVYQFASALADLGAEERAAVFDLLMQEVGAALQQPSSTVA